MYKAFAAREHMIVFLYRLAEKLAWLSNHQEGRAVPVSLFLLLYCGFNHLFIKQHRFRGIAQYVKDD